MLTVLLKQSSRKTVSFKEQIVSKEQISIHTFEQNRGYCLFLIMISTTTFHALPKKQTIVLH